MKSRSADTRVLVAARTRVLVIDDDSTMLQFVSSVLEAGGYDCLTAAGAEQALAVLRATPDFLVAICDIRMPGMDGLDLLKSISSQSTSVLIPRFIFLTADPQVEAAIAALRLGAVDFLIKPVGPGALLRSVRDAVGRVRRHRAVAESLAGGETLAPYPEASAAALGGWKGSQSEQSVRSSAHKGPDFAMLGLDHLRRPRHSFEPLGDLDDVAWGLLLELLRAEKGRQRLAVSALSMSIDHISPSTALRRIRELVNAGHIVRNPDPQDARRDFVTLAAESRVALEQYLAHVARKFAAAASTS